MNELRLPFVNDLKHLGNVLQSDNSMTIDCIKKRAIFISKIHSLNQEFYYNRPDVILKLYNIGTWMEMVLQELLNKRMNNLYVKGFDDYVITEMINM